MLQTPTAGSSRPRLDAWCGGLHKAFVRDIIGVIRCEVEKKERFGYAERCEFECTRFVRHRIWAYSIHKFYIFPVVFFLTRCDDEKSVHTVHLRSVLFRDGDAVIEARH